MQYSYPTEFYDATSFQKDRFQKHSSSFGWAELCTHRHINQTISTLYYYYLHFLHIRYLLKQLRPQEQPQHQQIYNGAYFNLAYWISQQWTVGGWRDATSENFNNNTPRTLQNFGATPRRFANATPHPHTHTLGSIRAGSSCWKSPTETT